MKKSNFFKKIAAVLGAAVMMAGMVIPTTVAFAEKTTATDPIDTAKLTIGKTITTDGDTWPTALKDASFTFKLTAEKALINEDGLVYTNIPTDAVDPVKLMPLPESNTTNGITTTNTGSVAENTTIVIKNFGGATDGDSEYEQTGLLNIKYTAAGAYMYTLEEVIPDDADKIPGVTYDTNKYTVVVYVTNVVDENNVPTGDVTVNRITSWLNDKTSVQWTDLTDTDNNNVAAGTAGTTKVGISTTDKANELKYPFENSLETSDLTVEKKVTGDLGDVTKHFDFTVTISGVSAGQTYNVEYKDGGNDIPATDTTHDSAKVTPAADSNGKITFSPKLKHGESFTIKDLPVGATYTVEESGNNHVASFTGSEAPAAPGDTDVTSITPKSNSVAEFALTTDTITVDKYADTLSFTNNRVSPTLTGVIMQYLPFIGIAVIAIGGFVVMMISRKKHSENMTGRY